MIRKSYKEMQKGDVFRTEYGDYGNYVTIVFESNEVKDNWLKTIGHYYNSDRKFEGYSRLYSGRVYKYIVYEKNELIKE